MFGDELRVFLLGDPGVGKTCLINQFVSGEFISESAPSPLPVTFHDTKLCVDGRIVYLQLWDLRVSNVDAPIEVYFGNAHCCILVYDVASPRSFDSMSGIYDHFSRRRDLSIGDGFPFLLLGNKSDLGKREVEPSAAEAFAQTHGGMPFFEVSAKTGEALKAALESLVRNTLTYVPKPRKDPPGRRALRIQLRGAPEVGKTCLFGRYVCREFYSQYTPSIGSDFGLKKIDVDGRSMTLVILDTPGHDRSAGLNHCGRFADACILVYDVTSPSSFDRLSGCYEQFSMDNWLRPDEDFPFMLLGNKCDAEGKAVEASRAEEFARAHRGMLFFEVSAGTGENLEVAFEALARRYLESHPKDDCQIPPPVEKRDERPESNGTDTRITCLVD
jgi:Ras-related protein Rab-7A